MHCGSIWHWGDITENGTCQRWKADVAFSFLSFIFWLASAIIVSLYLRFPYPNTELTHIRASTLSILTAVPPILIVLGRKLPTLEVSKPKKYFSNNLIVVAAGTGATGSKHFFISTVPDV